MTEERTIYVLSLGDTGGYETFEHIVAVPSREAINAYFREENKKRKANREPLWVQKESDRWTDGAWDMVIQPVTLREDL